MTVDLLALHDAGEALPAPQRALLLAGAAPGPAPGPDEPVGRTHARLLRLHDELAGPRLEGTVTCPACAEAVEVTADCAELLACEAGVVAEPAPVDGLVWRPVSYDDLALAATAPDERAAVAAVLARCVSGDVPAELRPRLSAAMAGADALAEIELDLTCPACGRAVRALLDVAAFTWAQVVARAHALLVEVDALARVYSWSEAEILALPSARRRRFVELATGGAS